MERQQIHRDDARYPPMLMERLGTQAPSPLTAIGSLVILRLQRLGLIDSTVQLCVGMKIILKSILGHILRPDLYGRPKTAFGIEGHADV